MYIKVKLSSKFLLVFIQPKQDIPIREKHNNTSDIFGLYKDKKSTLKGQNIEKDDIDLVSKSLDIESYVKNILS